MQNRSKVFHPRYAKFPEEYSVVLFGGGCGFNADRTEKDSKIVELYAEETIAGVMTLVYIDMS